jgi:hypothetical protein
MLGQGTGSRIVKPLGYALVGGLSWSGADAVHDAVIYLYLDRLSEWIMTWGGRGTKAAKTVLTLKLPSNDSDTSSSHVRLGSLANINLYGYLRCRYS